jgi:hypothetical protein
VLRATASRDVDPALVPMQRALRTAAALDVVPDDWHWPRWLDRQRRPDHPAFVPIGESGTVENVTGRDWRHVGTVSSGWLAMVDARGTIAPVAGGWSLDWLVRAEDRWHRPATEAAVRQRAPGGSPVTETACRVPGGDVVQRVYGATLGGDAGDVVVVEIDNQTPLPVAVAFALRPADLLGVGMVGAAQVDEERVIVNNRVALVLDRRPARVALGDAARDSASAVVDEAPDDERREVRDDLGLANATVVVPVAHRTSVRVALVAGGDRRTQVSFPALPTADSVVRGWDAHGDRGASIELPDERVGAVYRAATRTLLLAAGGGAVAEPPGAEQQWSVADEALVVRALHAAGLHEAANAVLRRRGDELELDGWYRRDGPTLARNEAIFHAIGDAWALSRDRDTIDAVLGPAVKAAHWSERFRTRRARSIGDAEAYAMHDALLSLARALTGVEQPEAAADVSAFAARFVLDHDRRPDAPLVDIDLPVAGRCGLDVVATVRHAIELARAGDERALLASAWLAEVAGERGRWPTHVHPRLGTGSAGSGDDPRAAAAVVELVRALAVRVDGPSEIALLPVAPAAWYGQPVDVRRVPTAAGTCSYSVRWHGARPALLWEIERVDDGPVTVTCPALDPAFRSDVAAGEALLAAPPSPAVAGSAAPTVAPAPPAPPAPNAPTGAAPGPAAPPEPGASFG